MNDKKAVALPFNWIFALIVGAFILFFALYAASRFVDTGERTVYTESAAQFISLFDPLETGLASGKSSQITFRKDTKLIFRECYPNDNPPFGKQKISYTEKTFGDKYGTESLGVSIKDKYIFSEEVIEGKEFYMFSKPYFMPFKITDLIIISSKDYCFYQAPSKVKRDINGLNLHNINFFEDQDELTNCSGVVVCFDSKSQGCDIRINGIGGSYDRGIVNKDGENMYYKGNLLYAAIFSSPGVYECNIKRIMARFRELGNVYLDKIKVIKREGCSSTIETQLQEMINVSGNLDDSGFFERSNLLSLSGEIDQQNRNIKSGCKVY